MRVVCDCSLHFWICRALHLLVVFCFSEIFFDTIHRCASFLSHGSTVVSFFYFLFIDDTINMEHNQKSQSSSLIVLYTKSRILETMIDSRRLEKDAIPSYLVELIIAWTCLGWGPLGNIKINCLLILTDTLVILWCKQIPFALHYQLTSRRGIMWHNH